jgi:hypothetical protein
MVVDLIYNQKNSTLIDRLTGRELIFDGKFINGQLEDKQLINIIFQKIQFNIFNKDI